MYIPSSTRTITSLRSNHPFAEFFCWEAIRSAVFDEKTEELSRVYILNKIELHENIIELKGVFFEVKVLMFRHQRPGASPLREEGRQCSNWQSPFEGQ